MNKKTGLITAAAAAFIGSIPFWGLNYTLTLHAGDNTETIRRAFYDKIDLPEPKREHYIFSGWYDINGEQLTSLRLLGSRELTAKFVPETYTVSFADDLFPDLTYTADSTIDLPVPEKEHYTFIGWSDGESILNDTGGICKNMILTAEFEPETYSITFEPDGGTMPAEYPREYTYGVGTDFFPAPVKNGYTFTGWYEDEAHTIKADFAGKTEFGDRTYYAAWKETPKQPSGTSESITAYPAAGIDRIYCGGFSANIYDPGNMYDVNETTSIVNAGNSALRYYLASEYIADHASQGFGATLCNNTLTIVNADGSSRTYHKVSTHYGNKWSWVADDGTDILSACTGLITQTCTGGDGIAWVFWE